MTADRPTLVRSRTPVRVADIGGWTDTWFGAPGQVCHLAVGPGVQVEARVVEHGDLPEAAGAGGLVRILAPAVGADVIVGSGDEGWSRRSGSAHPLLEQAVAAVVEEVASPEGLAVEVAIRSHVPPGASLGTSASVVVALIGALDALVAGGGRDVDAIARLAHHVETVRVGREAGVQDQWAAAKGGAALLAIGPYPDVRHHPVPVPPPTTAELRERLVTVVFGPHDSSRVHAEVIDALVACSGGAHDRARRALRTLSTLAVDGAAALARGDVDEWAQVLTASTQAQGQLHAGLVGPAHERAIEVARSCGAAGWKVNGAGGDGGSLTVVAGGAPGGAVASAASLATELAAAGAGWEIVPLTPDAGLVVEVR